MQPRRHSAPTFALAILLGLITCAGAAYAQNQDDQAGQPDGDGQTDSASVSVAEARFHEARSAFDKGDFAEAASAFLAAYDAKPLPELLFNAGACYEKLAKREPANLEHWQQAIRYYQRYLDEAPEARDHDAITARIAVLEGERARIEAEAEAASDDEVTTVETSDEVEALEDIGIRGLVIIESTPPGATIYLDDQSSQPLGKTPWSGTLEGEHTVYIERQGYKPLQRRIAPLPDRLILLAFALAEESTLGWVEITANVPGADIYIDDKSVGVFRKTPFSGNLPPGPHKVWITTEGYDEHYEEIDVVAGEVHKIEASLSGTPVGYLDVRGRDIEQAKVYVDGELLCERGPCRQPVPEGEHEISVERDGHKPYRRDVVIDARTELKVSVKLVEEPGRADAVWSYVFAAAFIGGGVALGLQAQGIQSDLEDEIAAGAPPPDSRDPRFLRGQLFAYGADAAFVLGGASLLAAIYYTFRDKGPDSTASTQVKSLTMTPHLSPYHAGLGMEIRW
ncbi:MAG: hypothetical protein Tsb0020_05140 [Haliangiales bacterium]